MSDENFDVPFSVRISKAQNEIVEQARAKKGLSKSDWFRAFLDYLAKPKKKNNSKISEQTIQDIQMLINYARQQLSEDYQSMNEETIGALDRLLSMEGIE